MSALAMRSPIGECRRRLNRVQAALSDDGRGGAGDREEEQRPLLDRALPKVVERAQAVQRPDVEQQKDERQRDVHLLRHQRERHRDRDAEHPPRRARVEPEREHGEERRQRVFPLRRPRHRLDVHRMDGEERGDECGRPRRARQLTQRQEQQERADRVQKDAGQEMHPRARTPHA